MRQRLLTMGCGLGISILLFAMVVIPVAAQSEDSDDAYRTFWRIIAAVLLVAFIAVVVYLLSTRWRRLINWPGHGE